MPAKSWSRERSSARPVRSYRRHNCIHRRAAAAALPPMTTAGSEAPLDVEAQSHHSGPAGINVAEVYQEGVISCKQQ